MLKKIGIFLGIVFGLHYLCRLLVRNADDKGQEAIHVYAVQVPAQVPDDFLHLSVYRDDAVLVALYR